MKHLIACTAALFLLVSAALAQNGIGLSSVIVGPDSVMENSTDSITVFISNDAAQTISGTVEVKLAVGSASYVVTTDSVTTTLQPGDSTAVNFVVSFNQTNGFAPGGNIVLIWPEMGSVPTTDTLLHSVHVTAADLDSLGCDAGNQSVPPVLWQDFQLTWNIVNRGSETIDQRSFEVVIATYDGPTLTPVSVIPSQTVFNLAPQAADHSFANFDINWVQQFGDGGSVIVVWPRMPDNSPDSFVTVDSLWIDVEVAPVSTPEPESESLRNIKVFPNPATGIVYVRYLGGNEPIKRVTVTDLNGRVVEQHGFVPQLDLTSYEAGYYLVEVEIASGESRIFKLCRY